jgi:hypothetical protein
MLIAMQGRLSNAMHARTMRVMSYCMSLQRNIAATLVEGGSRAHQRVVGWTVGLWKVKVAFTHR